MIIKFKEEELRDKIWDNFSKLLPKTKLKR